MFPYRIVSSKACYLLVELEHRAYWVVKKCNLAYNQAGEERKLQLQELEELRLEAYENSRIYKSTFQTNGQQLKIFHEGPTTTVGEVESISLIKPALPEQHVNKPPLYSFHALRTMHPSSVGEGFIKRFPAKPGPNL
ncbi:hypothetical protein CR513_07230, partial [Mucuna pruriens]